MKGEGVDREKLRTCVCMRGRVCVQANIWLAWKLASLFRYSEFRWIRKTEDVRVCVCACVRVRGQVYVYVLARKRTFD